MVISFKMWEGMPLNPTRTLGGRVLMNSRNSLGSQFMGGDLGLRCPLLNFPNNIMNGIGLAKLGNVNGGEIFLENVAPSVLVGFPF